MAGAILTSDSGASPDLHVDPDWVLDNKLVFRDEGGTILTVADGTSETFSLQIWVPYQNRYVDGKVIELVVRGSYDIETSDTGSSMAFDQPIVGTGPIPYRYEAVDTGLDTDTGACVDTGLDTGVPQEDTGGDTSVVDEPEEKESRDGCSCAQGSSGPGGIWMLLGVGVLCGRRRSVNSAG